MRRNVKKNAYVLCRALWYVSIVLRTIW